MKILLTGASGYLGGILLPFLVKQNDQVVVTTRRKLRNVPQEAQIDVSNDHSPSEWRALLEEFDGIIHCATSYGRSGESEAEIARVNYELPARLCEAMRDGTLFMNIDTALPKELNAYAWEKGRFREFLSSQIERLTSLNIPLEHFFGAGDGHFLSKVLTAFFQNDDRLPLTPGLQQRDFIAVEDVIDAFLFLLERYKAKKELPTHVPLGSGQARTIKSVVQELKAGCPGCPTELDFGALPLRALEPETSCADLSVIHALGWKPRVHWHQALPEFIHKSRHVWRTHGHLTIRPELQF